MFGTIAKKIFGSANDRTLTKYQSIVDTINGLEDNIAALSENDLKAQTAKLRQLLKEGSSLEDILPEAFATVREVSKRVLGMRHYDVQMLGGIILHRGMITEMKTGEGKTLVATLPAYLNAIEGKGVHVVSVNDYLVRRDAEWMGKIYDYLGLSVGCITAGMMDYQRKQAYHADITYGTNNEFGFDYLRDNMKLDHEQMCGRPFNYAIIDEVDSILIDEARTPLIISGQAEDSSELYVKINTLIPSLKAETDFELDEKANSVSLTDEGIEHVEQLLIKLGLLEESSNLYDISSIGLLHHVDQALKAHQLFTRDKDYIVKEGKIVIIDEFTGRMMDGRRYSEGLHQALEAKEAVPIQHENQTLASITFQNYFRMYPKLSGMTGTAMTEAEEFAHIYNLEVIAIPTHIPIQRIDEEDIIYCTLKEKNNAIIERIVEAQKKKQPILVGTVSIEKSEMISHLLKLRRIPHHVLNARHHEKEAHIIAQAGRLGAVTIATNMAGRGTDIVLGGNLEMRIEEEADSIQDPIKRQTKISQITEEIQKEKEAVKEAGGLFVLATERHESRRIDNQLRGRSGRQGDPGLTQFYLSLEDDLMRIFGSERISGLLSKIGFKEGEAINHRWISRAIEKAQGKVEARNYEIRKNLLKFDDVMNDQRHVIFEQRIELMQSEEVLDMVALLSSEVIDAVVETHMPQKAYAEQWDKEGLHKELHRIYGIHLPVQEWLEEEGVANEEITKRIHKAVTEHFDEKEKLYGKSIMETAAKRILLITIDELWKDHLLSLDHLRQGIGLRAYGQKDPLNEYKREAFMLFQTMMEQLKETVVSRISHVELSIENQDTERLRHVGASNLDEEKMQQTRIDPLFAAEQQQPPQQQASHIPIVTHINPEDRDPNNPESWGKVTRNELCPCGSGKKYKHCHGKLR